MYYNISMNKYLKYALIILGIYLVIQLFVIFGVTIFSFIFSYITSSNINNIAGVK